MAEILTQAKGKLIAGPPKTRAGRRTVGLPPFVVRELEAHLAVAQRPGSHVFTPPVEGPPRVPGFRARSWVPATKQPACMWIAAGATPKEVAVRRAHLGQLHPDRYGHQTIPWPVAEGRCHPVRD